MSYTKTVDFQAKDALASGNPSKIIKGTEIDDEFDAIQVADALNLKRDGTTTASADIPMGSHKLTGLAAGTTAGDSVRYEQFASPPAIGGTTPSAGSFTTLGGTVITASTKFAGPGTDITGVATGLAAGDLAGGTIGQIPYQSASNTTELLAVGPSGYSLVTKGAAAPAYENRLHRGYIDGLVLSTAGGSATMSIAAGQASDSTNAFLIDLAASISKTTSAWAVGTGNGGKLSAAAIANSTWYYFYLIRRTDTGVVDVGFDVSATTPTMPTGYTQYRYIGAGLTDGSAQWTKFIQVGDEFWWDALVLDVTTAASGTTAVTAALTVPRKRVKALLNVSPQAVAYISDLSVSDEGPSATGTAILNVGVAAGGSCQVWTNTSAQVRYRCSVNGTLYITTAGWIDRRGRNE